MAFQKKILIVLIIFNLLSNFSYGQTYDLLLTTNEKDNIIQRISQKKDSDLTTAFIKKAIQANISNEEIDSLLVAKEVFLHLKKRTENLAKLRDSLFLFSENTGTLKRENFNAYRKSLTTILSHEQFYELYKELIDSKATLATQYKTNELYKNIGFDNVVKKDLQNLIRPIYVDILLAEAYYIYDKKLAQYKKHLLEKQLAIKIDEKIKNLGLNNNYNIFDSPDSKMIEFIKLARSSNISDSLIVEITNKLSHLNKQLNDSKREQGIRNPDYLYTPYDESLNSSDAYRKFERYVTNTLSQNQYKRLFWKQFKPRIDQISNEKFDEFKMMYGLRDIKDKDKELIQKSIYKYTTNEFITKRYYAHESTLARIKVKKVQARANKAYKELVFNITEKPVIEAKPSQRVKDFLANAKEQGVDIEKARKIAQASLEYELKQEELMVLKKYDKRFIYSLDNDNSKTRERDSFRHFLTENLTKNEYQKLFWSQLEPEINARVKAGISKIKETYPKIKGNQLEDLREMVQNQTIKKTVAKYYYSYDKKIAKQKVKALDYKFNKEYKEKIKENSL